MSTIKTKRRSSRAARRFWLTPKGWNRRCGYCGRKGCIAYRRRPSRWVCERCIEERGIVAHESKSWRDGGAKTDPSVRIRFVDTEGSGG